MMGTKPMYGAIDRRRLIAGLSAFFLIATLSLFAGHHHLNETDTSTCLICNGVSAPALQTGDTTLPGVHVTSTTLPFPDTHLRIATGWSNANAVRAPPSC